MFAKEAGMDPGSAVLLICTDPVSERIYGHLGGFPFNVWVIPAEGGTAERLGHDGDDIFVSGHGSISLVAQTANAAAAPKKVSPTGMIHQFTSHPRQNVRRRSGGQGLARRG